MKIPDNTSDEEAATLGVGVVTCGQALYQSLELPLPGSGKAGIWLLIYGGSTATGSLAIQYVHGKVLTHKMKLADSFSQICNPVRGNGTYLGVVER